MNRSISKKQRINSNSHHEIMANHKPDKKTTDTFFRKPYTVNDALKKWGVDIKEGESDGKRQR